MRLAALALAGCASDAAGGGSGADQAATISTRAWRGSNGWCRIRACCELANEVEALRTDVRAMHNDVDQLSNDLEISRKQQRDLYADLDQRLKNLEARGALRRPAARRAASAAGAAQPVAAAAGAPRPSRRLPTAPDKAALSGGVRAAEGQPIRPAIAAFQTFLGAYPDSALADNAQYWLGEAYYVNKSFPEALAAFQRVVDKYPQSRKLPDALLKIGYCDYELKQWQAAKDALIAGGRVSFRTRPPGTWRSSAWRRWRPRSIDRGAEPEAAADQRRARRAEARAAARQ